MTANAPTNDGYWTDAGNYATSFAGGTGTEDDPYLISTPQQLAYLSYLINNSSSYSTYRSKYYEQTANLDMISYYWVPIGEDSNNSFGGCYDGGGFTISGIYTKETAQFFQGLFGNFYVLGSSGYVAVNKFIKNINIINSHIQGHTSANTRVGGIIGNVESSYNSTIEISNCSYSGVITASGKYIGGIIGSASSSNFQLFDCNFSGTINALESENVGGIIGYTYDGFEQEDISVEIYNCSNTGYINADNYAGGIVGRHYLGEVYNCFNVGEVQGSNYIGGIIGYASSDILGGVDDLYNCYNDGNITAKYSYAGGILGYHNMYFDYIEKCYNNGIINAGGTAGGVAGYLRGNYFRDCYNAGEVSGERTIGGVVGQSNCDRLTSCYNKGNIIGDGYIGGIVGRVDSYNGNIANCFNTGNITVLQNSSDTYVGSIVGYISTTNNIVRYCYYGVNCDITNVVGGYYGSQTISNNSTCSLANVTDENWFKSSFNWYNYSGWTWDFTNTWSIVEGMNDGYPILMPTLEIMQFTITYHPNGASGSEVVESKVGSESYTIRSNMFSRSGYNFTGWNTQANGSGQSYSAGSSYTDLANLDLYAQWSRITYTIKYNKNASDATGTMANTTKYYGTNVTLRSNAFKRTGYSFAGWATEKGGNVVYSNGATYTANANVTLYAKWTAHKYTVKFNGNGSTSGSMSNQTFTYGTAQKLTSNAFKKTGFTFSKWTRNADGTGTSYTNGQSVKNLTSTNGATINLYAQWTARNEAKYDSAGKYWYIENGKIPQTKVTNSTLISNLNKATTNGANYYIAGQTLTAKVYSGKEYCKWNNNWYEVEPIKWRLDASSSQKDGYGTTTDTNAVLAEIVYVDQYSSSSIDAGEGYSNQSVTDFMRNGISTTYLVNYATSTQTFGTGTSLYGTNASTTARMFVSSQSEINAVNGTMNITFSDLVEDMIKYYGGTNVYFTRDLGSNYNNIVCFNEVGREVQRFATDYRGVQFTVRFTEYGCVN